MIKRLIHVCFICVFIAFHGSAIDPSTPPDGNLSFTNTDGFIPHRIVLYSDKTALEERGLKVENNRIFKPSELPQTINPPLKDIHYGTNPAYSSKGDMVFLTGNSPRYGHGIFGSRENATGFAVMRNGSEIARYELPNDSVFETLRPTIADLIPGNRGEEIILTVSDKATGARISVYSLEGKMLGSSDAIGLGFRWLHLLAAADFGIENVKSIAVVRTPHIGGILQFYEWQQGKLVMVSWAGGFSTHQIGSDNLNMAAAADFDGIDGAELILPTNDYTELMVVKLEDEKIGIIDSFKLPGRLNTNIYFDSESPSSIWVGIENGGFVNLVE